jgi:hypothetical protein
LKGNQYKKDSYENFNDIEKQAITEELKKFVRVFIKVFSDSQMEISPEKVVELQQKSIKESKLLTDKQKYFFEQFLIILVNSIFVSYEEFRDELRQLTEK